MAGRIIFRWKFDFDRKNFRYTASNFYCREKQLAAKFDNSEYWFTPYCAGMITPDTFIRKVRKLAQHIGAKTVTVSTLDKVDVTHLVFFRYQSMFASDILSEDKENWEFIYLYCEIGKSPLFCGTFMYESQIIKFRVGNRVGIKQ